MIPHWLWHFLGADGTTWAFIWGGIGSIVVPYAGLYIGYRWHNVCHQTGCYRVGKHKITGKSGAIYGSCKVHHHVLGPGVVFDFATNDDTKDLFAKTDAARPQGT